MFSLTSVLAGIPPLALLLLFLIRGVVWRLHMCDYSCVLHAQNTSHSLVVCHYEMTPDQLF